MKTQATSQIVYMHNTYILSVQCDYTQQRRLGAYVVARLDCCKWVVRSEDAYHG